MKKWGKDLIIVFILILISVFLYNSYFSSHNTNTIITNNNKNEEIKNKTILKNNNLSGVIKNKIKPDDIKDNPSSIELKGEQVKHIKKVFNKDDFSLETRIETINIPKNHSINNFTKDTNQNTDTITNSINKVKDELLNSKTNDSKEYNTDLSENDNDFITPEEEVQTLYKESVIVNHTTLLYIGSLDPTKSLTRVLNIKGAIMDSIYKAAKAGNYSLETKIEAYGKDYILSLNNEVLLRVTNLDAQVNNVSKEKLSLVWKNNIDQFIKDSIRTIKIESTNEILGGIFKIFLITMGILLLLELISSLTRKPVEYIVKKIVNTIQKVFIKIRNMQNTNIFVSNKELIEEQINLIGKQSGIFYSFIIRTVQAILLFCFIVLTLYSIPETYTYTNQFVHLIISYCVVGFYSCLSVLNDKETWGGIIAVLLYIAQAVILIYLLKITTLIIKNLMNVMFVGEIAKIKRFETILLIIVKTLEILIIVLAFILILKRLGLNPTPLIAGAGIAGIALSFGAQNLIKDIINGIFIIAENQFGYGDIIKVNGCVGVVEDMTLRATIVRDLSAVAHIIPNSQITQVSVYTKNWSRANLDISIAYKDDINEAIKLIKEVADEMHKELSDIIICEPRVLGVNELGNSGIIIKLIMDTIPGEQWGVEREYRRRIKYAFDKNNIEIPFPHTTVYLANNNKTEQEIIQKEEKEIKTNEFHELDYKTYDGKLEEEVVEHKKKQMEE